jgi:hypothetical protein
MARAQGRGPLARHDALIVGCTAPFGEQSRNGGPGTATLVQRVS